MQIAAWNEVGVDLIGPWRVKVNGQIVVFSADGLPSQVTQRTTELPVHRQNYFLPQITLTI